MEPLGTVAHRAVERATTEVSQVSHLQALARPAKKTADGLPVKFDQETDFEIPRRVFSAFKPTVGPRELRRELRPDEREVLIARAAALEVALRPFDPDNERAVVTSSISAMLGGFRSMRQQGEDAASVVAVTRAVLRDFPAWAISQACMKIARHETKIDPRFAPNDSEIIDVVRSIVASYQENLEQARALLAAPVEVQVRRERPTNNPPTVPAGDGKHGQRVAVDLAERKSKRENADGPIS